MEFGMFHEFQRRPGQTEAAAFAESFEQVDEAERALKVQGGRLLLRYSGTEPKARLLLEGRDADALEGWSRKIIGAIQKQIGE